MDCVYEKPEIEKVEMRPKKVVLSGPESSESLWSGKSCFKVCRTKERKSEN